MNIFDFVNYLQNFSLPILVISALCAVITLSVKKINKTAFPAWAFNYVPLLSGVILYGIYHCIFVGGRFGLTSEIFYSGVVCGSLSAIYTVLIDNFFFGKHGASVISLSVKSNLTGVVEKADLQNATDEITALFDLSLDDGKLLKAVSESLNKYKIKGVSETAVLAAAETIVLSVNALKIN